MTLTVSPTASRRWLLGEPDFRRLWLVGLVVFSVRWLEMLAVAVFAYQRTGSPFIVALLTMLRMLPMALFGALIGAAAERVERRIALVFVMTLMLLCSIALALLAWSGVLEIWHIALASFISGLTWTTDNPVRRTMIGEVVGSRADERCDVDRCRRQQCEPHARSDGRRHPARDPRHRRRVCGQRCRLPRRGRSLRCGCAIAIRLHRLALRACSSG